MIWDGRYEVQRTLGEGGMGRVVLARDLLAGGRHVALKFLLPEYRDGMEDFLQEYLTQRRLNHPNIPKVYDFGFARHPRGEVPYMTMEYCDGIPLYSAIPRLRGLKPVWRWFLQLVRALDHIHRVGWLHRDIKPGNLLVQPQTESVSSVKLIDLGVATQVDAPPDRLFIGTPEYCAPEVLAGQTYDVRSDLYAAGLVLYEMITHRRPWSGSDEHQLMADRLQGVYPAIEEPACPTEVADLIGELLQPEPKNRPASAAEVISRFCDAVGMPTIFESADAFAQHMSSVPVAHRVTLAERGLSSAQGITLPGQPTGRPIWILEGHPGDEPEAILAEVADQVATQGTRVLRVTLTEPEEKELGTLTAMLTVLTRLRDPEAPTLNPTEPAAAAALLTRLDGPTLMVIEGAQYADAMSLRVLKAAFEGAHNANLKVLASYDATVRSSAGKVFDAFLGMKLVERATLKGLTPQQTATWLEAALGVGTLDAQMVHRLHSVCEGRIRGLVAGVRRLFEHGALIRNQNGYRGQAAPIPAPAPTPAQGGDEALAYLDAPVPRDVLLAYLEGGATKLPQLLAAGTLRENADGHLFVADAQWREQAYQQIPLARRMRQQRVLARALHEATSFPHQRSHVARALMASDQPVLAVPHLVVAAAEACHPAQMERATAYLADADGLIEAHRSSADERDVWRWMVMLGKARVKLALGQGDVGALERAAGQLLELGTEAAHIPTLVYAVETRMTLAYVRRDFEGLVCHAQARIALDRGTPSADGLGLRAWATGLSAMAQGDMPEALKTWQAILDTRAERARPEVLVRVAREAAHLVVEMGWTAHAQRAVDTYTSLAERSDDPFGLADARLLKAAVYRQSGQPERALETTHDLSAALKGDVGPALDAAISLGLAQDHLSFGWYDTAIEHAKHAQERLVGLDKPENELKALLVMARTHLIQDHVSGWMKAEELLTQAEALVIPPCAWSIRLDHKLIRLELALRKAGIDDITDVMTMAREVAKDAIACHAFTRAARALSIAAEAALRVRRAVDAQSLAENALSLHDRSRGSQEHLHHLLSLLARVRTRAGRTTSAHAIHLRALEQVRRVAASIENSQHRRAWLGVPENLNACRGQAQIPANTTHHAAG